MKFIDYNTENAAYWDQVYVDAFPETERFAMNFLLNQQAAHSNIHLSIIERDDEYVGICLHVGIDTGKAFILYLAIDAKMRGKNVGSEVLQHLKKMYPNGYILESEQTGLDAANEEQRVKRVHFYERNGLMDSRYLSHKQSGSFHVMRSNDQVTMEDYLAGISDLGIESAVDNRLLI